MLEASSARLAEASAADRHAAEALAASWLTTMLEQDLISADEAAATVAEHRAMATEEWLRAVYAALVGLRVVKG